MLFNSLTFLIFFPCVWLLYRIFGHRRQNWLLLLASYLFYGWWDWRFLSLLWISTVVDYGCGLGMERWPLRRRGFLLISIFTNLGILGFFKYFDFFIHSAARALTALGFSPNISVLGIILPVGISFYTFQTMAYTIDVYRGRQEPTKDMLSFAIYVAYFPQLVAGPIERSVDLLPQIQKPRILQREDYAAGAELCLMGYFKKVVIADGVAPFVDQCFRNSGSLGWADLVLGVYLFALQIYGDFSGYTDIARGVSRFFGIRLCVNFEQPYLSASITEFWRRWHVSLSSWLRDYLYIPLGGNRKGKLRTYLNNMVTMLLGGLWHGAGWTFVIWGALHGLYLAVHKLVLGERKVRADRPASGLQNLFVWSIKCFATFNLVCLTWIFFRAAYFTDALHYAEGIMTFRAGPANVLYLAVWLFFGAAMLLIDLLCYYQKSEVPFPPNWHPAVRGAAYGCMLFMILCLGERNAQPFIYFQF
ncbi:MAG: MBOAT family protein [Kiritimatiellae bacterium]|nr:MBOAT family protein [Kiritimatiellia bacterium]